MFEASAVYMGAASSASAAAAGGSPKRPLGTSGSSSDHRGSPEPGLLLLLESQQRMEQLLVELAKSQQSAEHILHGMQQQLCTIQRADFIGGTIVDEGGCGSGHDSPRSKQEYHQSGTASFLGHSALAPSPTSPPASLAEGQDEGLTRSQRGEPPPTTCESSCIICSVSADAEVREHAESAGDPVSAMADNLSQIKRRIPSFLARNMRKSAVQSKRFSHVLFESFEGEERMRVAGGVHGASSCYAKFQDPYSSVHVPWSLLGLSLLVLDLTITPCVLAWDIPFDKSLLAFNCFSTTYWAIDMVMCLFIGFYIDGHLITDMKAIAVRYAKTTMVPDVVTMCMDLFSGILMFWSGGSPGGSGSIRLLRFAKLGRAIRLMNLLRVLRCMRIVSSLVERTLSERLRLFLYVLSMSMLTLWFNHLVACAWFIISHNDVIVADRHWTDEYDFSHVDEYIASFHWALAQITLGSIDIVCQNSAERLFNILCLIIGLVVGTTLISTLSATMVDFQMLNKDRLFKMFTLRQYLNDNMIKGSISLLVTQQASQRMRERRHLVEAQVPALDMLSTSLRGALRFEIVQPYLFQHQFFFYLSTVEFRWCAAFCQKAMSIEVLSTNDDLFLPHAPAKAAYVLMRGGLEYEYGTEALVASPVSCASICGRLSGQCLHTVPPQTWLAEAALWTEWVHLGQAVATETCQVMVITPIEFEESIRQFPSTHGIVDEYGMQFHRMIIECAKQPSEEFLTDLMIPYTEWDDIVLSMSAPWQQAISHAAVDVMDLRAKPSSARHSRKGLGAQEGLRCEIDAGKCIMVLRKDHVPERIVSVVALQVSREDGCILTQVGKWSPDDGGLVPACELPGMKREASVGNAEALRTLLLTKLKPLAAVARLQHTRRHVSRKKSRKHHVETKYLRYVLYCDLREPFEAPRRTATDPWHSESHDEANDDNPAGQACQGLGISWISSMKSQDSKDSSTTQVETAEPFQSCFRSSTVDDGSIAISEDFLSKEVFFFRYDGRGDFYAWLSPQEFEYLSGSAGEPVLAEWLASLGPPPLHQQDSKCMFI